MTNPTNLIGLVHQLQPTGICNLRVQSHVAVYFETWAGPKEPAKVTWGTLPYSF